MRQVLGLIVALLVCYGAAAVGGIFTASSVNTWYQTLQKPSYNPPDWVFGPVWTVLYGMMAVATWLVWRGMGVGTTRLPLLLFAVQLCLNVAWSGIFFGLQQPGWAFLELCALWVAICATAALFWRVSPLAGWLMVPYLLWVSFAAVLNLNVWLLNR